ncbi:MAG: DUF1566 domain-containing protein [Acidimicrobiia bacterium]|nr:DUF1566 domain-containing protein [Acidimicrobiia bacterium]
MSKKSFVCGAWLLLGVGGLGMAGETPTTVSPGDHSRLLLVNDRCPTFSWAAIAGAKGYELVVYRFGEDAEKPQPVLRRSFAGAVSGWTPSLDRCLERGGRYAWSVRAVSQSKTSEWSPASLFEVASGPSAAEFETAVETVRSYLRARREGAAPATEDSADWSTTEAPLFGETQFPLAPSPGTQLTVDGNLDAVSFSGDGAMLTNLAAANLTGSVALTNGGTGASDAAGARTNLGAASATALGSHGGSASAHHLPPTSLPPSGPAGGSLTGSYPNPTVAANTVTSAEIVDGSVATRDLAFDPATQIELDALGITDECEGFAVSGRRWVDRGDGTVRDCNTKRIWLKDATCLGALPYLDGANPNIFTQVDLLNSGTDFGCSDYTPGTYTDWEVPAMTALCGLWNGSCDGTGCCTASEGIVDETFNGSPTVANGKGDSTWTPGNVFVGVQPFPLFPLTTYYSATEFDTTLAWIVNLWSGDPGAGLGKHNQTIPNYVWPVRVGQ